jgi:hypothetical protein
MSVATLTEYTESLNLREQIARIDNILTDTQKKQREYHTQPWQVGATLLGGAAAFFAAGAAFIHLIHA